MLDSKMIGNKITEARKKISISQAQLAQRLFISSQAVGKWERGESTIRALLFGKPVGNDIWIALAWWIGIILIAYVFAMRVYKKRF